MLYGERQKRSAFYVTSDGVQKMNRLPFTSGGYDERWLQELIEDHPDMLPSGDVAVDFAPLYCIGREVEVGSDENKGYIDNLYVTPSGNVVVVETKLWRNQESRRTVVAQIIDYAKELQQWDADRLNAVAEDYTYRKTGQAFRIIDILAKEGHLSYSDEAALTDCLNANLKNASFLLLIVGDGIRSNVQQLAEFLNDNVTMSFHLGMVELELYQHDDGIFVIPFLQTKTRVIERRVQARVEYRRLSADQDADRPAYIPKPVLSRKEFVSIFCSRGGYNPDAMTEFLGDIEMVDGISIKITPTELHIDVMPDNAHRVTVVYFGISGESEASVYIRPDRLIRGLSDYGGSANCADGFLEFFREYVDLAKCKSAPYEFGANRFYYAVPSRVLESSSRFAGALEQLISTVSEA